MSSRPLYSRSGTGRYSRRDDYDSEYEDAAAEQRGIMHDYNPHNSRPHHEHHHHHSHRHSDRHEPDSHRHGHARPSLRRVPSHSGDEDVPDWEYHRGTRRRDRSADAWNGFKAFFDDMSEDGFTPADAAASLARSKTAPLGQTPAQPPLFNGNGFAALNGNTTAAAPAAGNTAAPANGTAGVDLKGKGKEVDPPAGTATSTTPKVLEQAPAKPAETKPAATPAAEKTEEKPATVTKADATPATEAKDKADVTKTTPAETKPATDAAAQPAATATTGTAAPKPQETVAPIQATQPAATPTAAPTTQTQPVPQAATGAPGVGRSGWERFRTDPRLRAALDRQMHERYGRYPGDAPGYNGYPYGPRHNHYGPRPNQPQDRRHQYNPYTGQHDRSSYYPYPPSGFPGEYVEDPMASRWASHQFAPPLYPFGRPLFANVPELPNLLNRAGAPYPILPAPPVEYLRDLDAQKAPTDKPSGPLSRTAPPAADFKDVLPLLEGKQTLPFLEALKKQELEPKYSDAVFRILSNVVQVRFGERENDKIINRVHVIPRGHYALGTVMADKPRLDVDLVLPSDFMLRRWLIAPTDKDICPKTASEALGLDAVSIARSEVDAKKLDWVLNAVWEQLDGVADGFVFPGGASEAQNYLPAGWCSRDTDNDKKGGNRLRLMTKGDGSSIRVNIFVKVAVNLNGQEMIVGVDQSSARSAGKYQAVKVLRNPGVPLGETPLSPIDRSAIITLNWWKRSLKPDGGFKIRTSHFLLALAALHALPPTHESHVPRAENTPLPFSIVRVMDVMTKILKYLKQAYNPPPTMVGTPSAGPSDQPVGPAIKYVFPLSSCTTMDALYTQAISTPADQKSLKKGEVFEQLETKVNAYIKGLESKGVDVKKYTVEAE